MTSDPLSLLRAGLDRDEQLARAAAGKSEDWRFADSWGVVGGPFNPKPEHLPPGKEWSARQARQRTIAFIEGPEAEHIANFDPARVLRQVEAIRDLAARSEENPVADRHDFDAGYAVALEDVVKVLASIYTEDTP